MYGAHDMIHIRSVGIEVGLAKGVHNGKIFIPNGDLNSTLFTRHVTASDYDWNSPLSEK